MPHTQLVAYSDIASSIAVILSVFSVLYARHAARAARDQADAARDQAEAATKQLTLEQDRRNEELAQLAEAEREREKRAEIDRSLLAEARLVNFEYDDAPALKGDWIDVMVRSRSSYTISEVRVVHSEDWPVRAPVSPSDRIEPGQRDGWSIKCLNDLQENDFEKLIIAHIAMTFTQNGRKWIKRGNHDTEPVGS